MRSITVTIHDTVPESIAKPIVDEVRRVVKAAERWDPSTIVEIISDGSVSGHTEIRVF